MWVTDLYLQLFEDQVRVKNLRTGVTVRRTQGTPYTHSRALVGNYTAAELMINAALREAGATSLWRPARVLMHPMAKCEGGLSQIEHRVLLELGSNAGARRVRVWVGAVLSDEAVIQKLNNPIEKPS